MTSQNKRLIAVFVAIGAILYYASPYWAVHQMKKAVRTRDAAALSHYVDFPAVKESLKASFSAQLNQKMGGEKENNPLVALGMAMVGAVLNPFIDTLVSPEGLATMMNGNKPDPTNPQVPTDSTEHDGKPNHHKKPNVKMGYESPNRFVVRVSPKEKQDQEIDFVFLREGLLSWKLSAIQFSHS